MIEVKMNLVDLSRIENDCLCSITVIQRLKQLGVPIIGVVSVRTVARGTLTWTLEEDMDGDLAVVRWYDVKEPPFDKKYIKCESRDEGVWSWTRYRFPGLSAPQPVDDEL